MSLRKCCSKRDYAIAPLSIVPALLSALCVSCGHTETSSIPRDAGSMDARTLSDSKAEAADVTIDAPRMVLPFDTGVDAHCPPPDAALGAKYASCSPNPCGVGQYCTDYVSSFDGGPFADYGFCSFSPPQCQCNLSCACLASWAPCEAVSCTASDGGLTRVCRPPIP